MQALGARPPPPCDRDGRPPFGGDAVAPAAELLEEAWIAERIDGETAGVGSLP